ncbi:MAG: beta-galactosidase, partial [Prevotella sp.]|nr:beta-galactosidase [Prevotella sp.]
MKKIIVSALLASMGLLPAAAQIPTKSIKWDEKSLIFDGKRVVPVMGEIHYSRLPENEWSEEIEKMKEGGVTMIATYVFWNHIEEQEGIFDWHGQRNLRLFIEKCKQADIPVILRLGPFCHGEVRNGGIPDWMFSKGCKMREENKTFMYYAERLYRQIFTQVQGLQWKDGGPVV